MPGSIVTFPPASGPGATALQSQLAKEYLGAKTADPSTDNAGNALIVGALYFNTNANHMRVWSGSAWVDYDAASDQNAAAALNSANAASASAATATTQAGISTTQAGTATTQASAAATSASQANTAKVAAETARDAAQGAVNIYASTAAGIAATTSGQYFSVPSTVSGESTILYKNNAGVAQEITRYASSTGYYTKSELLSSVFSTLYSKNLYDPSQAVSGEYVSIGDGNIYSAPGWRRSGYIPVTAGATYTLSANTGKQNGLAFFATNTSTTCIAGSKNNGAVGAGYVLTVTAPVGANFMVMTVDNGTSLPEPTQLQVEAGSTATAYEAYFSPHPVVNKSYVIPALTTPTYERAYTSKNLFDVTTIRVGKYMSASPGSEGQIFSASGWAISAFIPVTVGKQYTISGTRFYAVSCFFTAASDGSNIAASYSTASTVTAPAGAAYLVISLYDSSNQTFSNVQVEEGSVATSYTSLSGAVQAVDRGYLYPSQDYVPKLILSSSTALGSSSIETVVGGKLLRVALSPFMPYVHNTSNVFNFYDVSFDGVQFKLASDDAAPMSAMATTIGGNHGYSQTVCTMASPHGKTWADVGSVYSNGSSNWVICDIPSTTSIGLTAETGNAFLPAIATLSYVSGGTNTASFTPSSLSNINLFPSIKNRTLSIFVDGLKISNYDQTYTYSDAVTFSEYYEIMEKDSLVAWLKSQAGSLTAATLWDGTSVIAVSNNYVFDTLGGCAIQTDILALQNVSAFSSVWFTQSMAPNANGGTLRYYIPKSKAFVESGTAYDFTTLYDMTTPPAVIFGITPARSQDPTKLPDRCLQFNNSYGAAIGYLPIQTALPATRASVVTRSVIEISPARKVYMHAVDSASKASLTAGDYYSVVAYRSFFQRVAGRTGAYTVRGPDGWYLYLDWHNVNKTDHIELPAKLQGKSVSVVESLNATLLSQVSTTGISANVASSGSYGYLVLRFG